MSLIGKLFSGRIDIVGDVHGEIDALEALLHRLDYRADGSHPHKRRLVFVGDLVDRGPDSPAVVERVIELVRLRRAQCVLGNHELNLLLDDKKKKEGNDWFTDPDSVDESTQRVQPDKRNCFLDFFRTRPLVLERDDLRVVHACWNHDAIEQIRHPELPQSSASSLHDYYRSRIDQGLKDSGVFSEYEQEKVEYSASLIDCSWEAPIYLPAHAEVARARQTDNPVKVITSGEEQPTKRPFWAGGRWRMVERQKWWDRYDEEIPVIVGHYWRRISKAPSDLIDKYGPDLFEGIKPHHWMGKHRNVYCVDFSVGARQREREKGGPLFEGKLSALRLPECEVYHDDGSPIMPVSA